MQKKGYVTVMNNSDDIVHMKKHAHIADLRICELLEPNNSVKQQNVRQIYDISCEDISHLQQPVTPIVSDNYVKQVSIDPDGQMSVTWRTRLSTLSNLLYYIHMKRATSDTCTVLFKFFS